MDTPIPEAWGGCPEGDKELDDGEPRGFPEEDVRLGTQASGKH